MQHGQRHAYDRFSCHVAEPFGLWLGGQWRHGDEMPVFGNTAPGKTLFISLWHPHCPGNGALTRLAAPDIHQQVPPKAQPVTGDW